MRESTRTAILCAVVCCAFILTTPTADASQRAEIDARIAELAEGIEPDIISWRRDIHEHPELGNREFRTAELVAKHLRSLGFDQVRTRVAHTGVVGVLKGGRPGGVVALRADMDALPVTEKLDLPFSSKVRTTYNGQEVGVMHACGHDAHTSILMGAASVLAALKDELHGTVVFIFQPAEEGPPEGEEGGASLMIEQGALDNPRPEAIFGLHTMPDTAGTIAYRSGGLMASADQIRITVKGRQTHGAVPWGGVDPIVTASQIILALQTIPSRQIDVTASPAVISIGSIHGGNRNNIIPDEVVMEGTVRCLHPEIRTEVLKRIERVTLKTAESAGAVATFEVPFGVPVTFNDPELTQRMVPTLIRILGSDAVREENPATVSEDFSEYQQVIPGMYFFLGVNAPGVAFGEAPMNHSPFFFVNEDALVPGVRALAGLAWDFLNSE